MPSADRDTALAALRELVEAGAMAVQHLERYQRGESGLPFEPAEKVVRPALEAISPALAKARALLDKEGE